MSEPLPGSIQYLEAKLTGRLDAIARACEEGFVMVGKTFEAVARAQAEVYAADVERLTVKLTAANAQLAGAAAQVAELQRGLLQAERERDGARETAQFQAKTIGEYSGEVQRLHEQSVVNMAVFDEKLREAEEANRRLQVRADDRDRMVTAWTNEHAALGCAVAALTKLYDRFKAAAPGSSFGWVDAILADPTCAAAGEAWRQRFDVLREHYLAGIECDHEAKTDRALCACSLVDLGRQPSVGAAVQTWIDHVAAVDARKVKP